MSKNRSRKKYGALCVVASFQDFDKDEPGGACDVLGARELNTPHALTCDTPGQLRRLIKGDQRQRQEHGNDNKIWRKSRHSRKRARRSKGQQPGNRALDKPKRQPQAPASTRNESAMELSERHGKRQTKQAQTPTTGTRKHTQRKRDGSE